MEHAQASEDRGYNILSQILFHLHATQDGGEKYVRSLSRVGGMWLCSTLLAINP